MRRAGTVDGAATTGSSGWRTLLLFGLVGGVGTLAQFAVLIALVHGTGSGPVLASTAGAVVGALVNFVLNHAYTFRGRRDWRSAGSRYLVTVLIGFALNAGAMAVLFHALEFNYLVSQILATGLVFVVNFLVSNYWAFREHAA